MATKRAREDDSSSPSKKQKKGFSVGPANLPEGTYKRKVQKIKKDLIHKAKLRKEYAKIKAQEQSSELQRSVYDCEHDSADVKAREPQLEPTLEPHPDRRKLLEEPSPEPASNPSRQAERGKKRPRPQPYRNETKFAQKRREEAEAKRKAREEADKERARKRAERERFRKTIAKARGGGSNGQRKLGRESAVLLEKVKRLVGNA
ncbi:hypothetical protein CC78DRAFT_468539 [Lojkania enalia]|uniref:rRNA-processing protein FYV7 n=1 Tax=Lojkania enalia TaxID=147567 RepID=A0A9P4K6G8_9PLEO|nr:hypothetical protein CC78DRAFT_468539 [Didymosphaeria enalia]